MKVQKFLFFIFLMSIFMKINADTEESEQEDEEENNEEENKEEDD